VITRAQYTAIHNYRVGREGGKQASGDQSSEQADVEIRLVLADMFKDGFPDWFPVNDLQVGGESTNDSAAVINAQQPTATTPAPDPCPVMNDFEQLFNDPSLFNPETAKGCAEASKDGFPLIAEEGEFGVSEAFAKALSSTMSAPDPVGRFEEQPSQQSSDFGFGCIDKEGESCASGSSTKLAPAPAPAPLAGHQEHSFYQSPPLGLECLDEWSRAFLSDLLQQS
jgi:hypothetical protein